MDFAEYQKLAMVTKKDWKSKKQDLADCGLGIAGEAGEVADIIKKHLSGSKIMNEDDIKKELGDIMWYIASFCDCLKFDMETLAKMNIEKLKKRHGDKFSGYGNRDEGK